MAKPLLDDTELEKSEVVANAVMNRQRNLTGGNSYAKELGFSPIDFLRQRFSERRRVAWLDLCCGTGRALVQAAQLCKDIGLAQKITLVGVDLVPMFDPVPAELSFLSFEASSLNAWRPQQRFDLISCIHGLHYVGDKLGIIGRFATWLQAGGLFVAHLDYANFRLRDLTAAHLRIGRDLHRAGFRYQSKRHLLTCRGPVDSVLPYRYLGADDRAGPNCTGQPAVNSHYARLAT